MSGEVAAAIGSAASDLSSSIVNNVVNWRIAQENRNLTRETNSQNEALMREAWARDDTARQRMVKDLEAAGLSKWLAAGASPMNSSPISLTAPQNDYKANFDFGSAMDKAMAAFQNVQYMAQTEAQTKNIQDTNELLQEQIKEARSKAALAAHDVLVYNKRPDVATNDPQTAKLLAQLLNEIQDPESMIRKSAIGRFIFGTHSYPTSTFEETVDGVTYDLPIKKEALIDLFGEEGYKQIIQEGIEADKKKALKKQSKKTYQQEADENEASC